MNPKEQVQKSTIEADEQAMQSLEGIQEQMEESQAQVEESAMNPLNEVLGQVESAYSAYMDAQRQVSNSFSRTSLGTGSGLKPRILLLLRIASVISIYQTLLSNTIYHKR